MVTIAHGSTRPLPAIDGSGHSDNIRKYFLRTPRRCVSPSTTTWSRKTFNCNVETVRSRLRLIDRDYCSEKSSRFGMVLCTASASNGRRCAPRFQKPGLRSFQHERRLCRHLMEESMD